MAEIAAWNKNKRYYKNSFLKLQAYAKMRPPVDKQK